MRPLRRELGQSRFRWVALIAAALAAAVHAGDAAAGPVGWRELVADAELVAVILTPLTLVLGTVETLRSRWNGLHDIERMAVRSLLSVRSAQLAAVVIWSALAAFGAVGIGLLVARPAFDSSALVLSALPGLTPVLGAMLGYLLGLMVRHGVAVLVSAAVAGAFFLWEHLGAAAGTLGWGSAQAWLVADPVHSALAATAEAPTVAALAFTGFRALLWVGGILVALGLIVLVLRPRPGEVVLGVVYLALGVAAGAGAFWGMSGATAAIGLA